eukprot:TRINITY_DN54088_c0_g1_i1.p1 TRINITY_DN54088_c0_g1~~TRINITY_DN54088_c0_g1_i1.p1  ORF type:complete len:509 (-),score=107.86 TRINITY_DN54088_c0_g1_i1:258-1784(-)
MMAPSDAEGETKVGEARKAVNGFFMVHDVEAIDVNEQHIAPLSLAQEALSYVPPPDLVVYKFKNGDGERKIHCNTELSAEELEQLKKLQQEAINKNLTFYPSISVAATRYLSRARGDVKKALSLMCDTQAWRSSFFGNGAISSNQVMGDLNLGIVYFVGRDKDLRPTLVCRANRIPQEWYKNKETDRLIRIIIFCMEYMARYMLVPGKVEGNNLIVDLKDLSASQVPIKELAKLYSVMSHHYMGRVFKFYVMNLSTMLSMIASAAKSLLTDRQKQKLNFLNSPSELAKDFALHQLEQDHGGTRPALTSFFPFPMAPGPFEAGYSKGPHEKSVERVDKLLTAANCRGKLWDPRKSREDNTRIEWPVDGVEIFERCGLEVPAHLAEKVARLNAKANASTTEANAGAQATKLALPNEVKLGAPTTATVADTPTSCLPASPSLPMAAEYQKGFDLGGQTPATAATGIGPIEEEDDEGCEIIYSTTQDLQPDLTAAEVSPSSWFCCTSCSVAR